MSGAPDNSGAKLGGGEKPQLQQQQQQQQQIAIQKSGTATATFPINLVSAAGKLTHVKSTTLDTIKVSPVVQQTTNIVGGQQQQVPTATFRTISAGPPSQVRVVMPPGTLMPQTMIKQMDGSGGGIRTQITTIPARTISQTSITVTRPATPTTYIPRAGVTATNIQTQRLTAPIRTPTPPTVTGLSPGGFLRGTTVARNPSSPATTVISPTNATWMAAAGGTAQVQLIRTINQTRPRLIAQNIGTAVGAAAGGTAGVVAVGPAAGGGNQTQVGGSTIPNTQQTFVATLATVLPPRQQTATLVYSNVSNSQGQQYTPTGGTTQRFTVAAAAIAGGANQRQMRPIQLGNRTFSTAKLGVGGMNTTSISIRAPNIPVLTPSINASNVTTTSLQARTNSTGNVNIATNSLSTTRIIQLQQQQPTGAQQIIGPTGRLTSNLMLQPIMLNATGAGKIGIRPTTAVTTKVQPSLTITQLGLGQLTPSKQQQAAITSLQGATITQQQSPINSSSGVVVSAAGTIVQSQIQQPQTINVNVSQNQQQPIAQLVSVNPNMSGSAGQLITPQNVQGSPTVVPLSIQSCKGGNVFTGTITPIKASGTTISAPITKVIQQSHQHPISVTSSQQQQITEIIASTQSGTQQHHPPTSVFIHRPGNTGNIQGSGATATVIPVTSGTFLPAGGGTYYYESVPANSVTVSTGVLSLTTTTITSSVSQSQSVSTTSNLPTGLVTSIPYSSAPGTFTVVPSTGGLTGTRTIGQIQIPVSSSANPNTVSVSQIQGVPIRFNPHLISSASTGGEQTITVTAQTASGSTVLQGGVLQQHQTQTIQQISQSNQPQNQSQHHQIITMGQAPQQTGAAVGTSVVQSGQIGTTMLIPVQTSIKLTGGIGANSPQRSTAVTNLGSVNTAFLRKRDNDGSPIRAAKNLAPTLLSMSSAGGLTNSVVVSLAPPIQPSITTVQVANMISEQQRNKERPISPPSRPGSSGGSTTVSANSSPGVDQQINEEITPINRLPNESSHFNPINDMYPNHQNQVSVAANVRRQHQQLQQQLEQHVQTTTTISNGTAPTECPPRKKPRRSTNDSQNSTASHQPQNTSNVVHPNQTPTTQSNNINNTNSIVLALPIAPVVINNNTNNIQETPKLNNNVVNNKENAKPTDFILKKPRTCNLLDSYKQNWKSANNHFQRHSDVKPREERRPTVMDLANQAHVAQKINGWKIHHLSAQMEDLCEIEGQVYDKLSDMLKQFDLHGKNSDIDRVSELIKGNMQRSKIISDGVNDARGQILKIFEHKSHVSDIIHRCASKRNFKKREKN